MYYLAVSDFVPNPVPEKLDKQVGKIIKKRWREKTGMKSEPLTRKAWLDPNYRVVPVTDPLALLPVGFNRYNEPTYPAKWIKTEIDLALKSLQKGS
tara:strand:- start:799 stop:1086 length:288 start_codon:yes stop_codon:yes gene_type:complete